MIHRDLGGTVEACGFQPHELPTAAEAAMWSHLVVTAEAVPFHGSA
jgi:hypothetical protein